ncbi:MAG: hypothetical protein WAO98_06390 [Alphaproteobacteria bacterium]
MSELKIVLIETTLFQPELPFIEKDFLAAAEMMGGEKFTFVDMQVEQVEVKVVPKATPAEPVAPGPASTSPYGDGIWPALTRA